MTARTPRTALLILAGLVMSAFLVIGILGKRVTSRPELDEGFAPEVGHEVGDLQALGNAPVMLTPSHGTSTREVITPDESMLGPAIYAVLDAGGEPVANAACSLLVPGQVLSSGKTNAQGEFAHKKSSDGMATLLVVAMGSAPLTLEVPRTAGRHVVRLVHRSLVSGQVLIDGQIPLEEIPLELFTFQGLIGYSAEVELALSQHGIPSRARNTVRAETGELGAFQFQGLPEDWRGELRLPVEYRLEDRTLAASLRTLNIVALDAPTENLVLRVAKRLSVVGRIVDLAGRHPSPVPGAVVLSELQLPREYIQAYAQGYNRQVVADDEGRFTLVLPTRSILGGNIRIEPPGREFFRVVRIEPVEVEGELDLGDVALSTRNGSQTLSLRVVDTESHPIHGAIASIDLSSPTSTPTDSLGRTTLEHVVPGVTGFTLHSLGYEATDVAVPEALPEILEIAMREGTLLDIQFQLPSGEVARNVEARFASAEHPYRRESVLVTREICTQIGCSFFEAFYPRDGTVVVRLGARAGGRIILNDLKPGVSLWLRVEGPFAGVIHEEQISPLHPGEHRIQRVVLPRAPGKLTGRVLDEVGVPLAQATVGIGYAHSDSPVGGGKATSTRTNANGEFRIDNIYSTSVYFFASSPGHSPFEDSELEIPEEGAFIEVRLESGDRVVTVTIEDETGKRWFASSVQAYRPGGAFAAIGRQLEDEEGVYLMRDLPAEELTVIANVHGVPYTRLLDPKSQSLLIRVPALGGVRATVHLVDESQVDETWLLCLIPTSQSVAVVQYAFLYDTNITDVFPGSYFLVLRRFPGGFKDMDDFVETSIRVPLEIFAGMQEEVEIWQQL